MARAQRHRTAAGEAVTAREIGAHLDVLPRTRDARAMREALVRLAGRGALVCERRHGQPVWRVSPRGGALLARAAAGLPPLPESPQHRAWRAARERASGAIGRLRRELRGDLRDAARLLEGGERVPSDAWFELAARLARDAWRVGSATYCLRDWSEPGDDAADADCGHDPGDESLPEDERERRRRLRAGRRNTALWEG